jgi:flagellar M-ring protein FliF
MSAFNTLQRWQDIPGVRQAGLLLTLAGAIAFGLATFFWSQKPAQAPLFAGLADRDAAEVVEALRTAGVEYQLDPITGAITVPEARLREVRMKLASQGLPSGTRGGIELIEKDQGFGTSQFVENARYQHALETEIARTIADLKPVKEARVHLALPKPSPFAKAHDEASASVMLLLYPGRQIEPGQIAAIVHLVASSIPDLSPARVTVIDQSGRLLTQSDPNSEEARSALQFEQRRRLETTLVQRIRDLLEPLTGPGRVSAQVSVDMDFAETEEAKETFTPDQGKVRNEQTSEQSMNAAIAQGIPGATSNTPPVNVPATPAVPPTPAATAPTTTQRSATKNYELDRTLSHTHSPPGRVRRVTAAVLIDNIPIAAGTAAPPAADATAKSGDTGLKPLDDAQLKQVDALVKEAIGFDVKRGDSVSVMNASFARAEKAIDDPGVPLWQQPIVRDAGRLAIGSIIVLLLIFFVMKPTLRNLTTQRLLPAGAELPVLASAKLVGDNASPGGAPSHDDKLRLARQTVAQDPKKVAQIVKNWVNDDA